MEGSSSCAKERRRGRDTGQKAAGLLQCGLVSVMPHQPANVLAWAAQRVREGHGWTPLSPGLPSQGPLSNSTCHPGHGRHCCDLEAWGSPRGHTPNTTNTSPCTSLLRTELCPAQAAQSHSQLQQDVPVLRAAGQQQGTHTRLLPAPGPSPAATGMSKRRQREGKTPRKLEALDIVKKQHCSSK